MGGRGDNDGREGRQQWEGGETTTGGRGDNNNGGRGDNKDNEREGRQQWEGGEDNKREGR
jgi:hypothetical protein